MLRKGVWPYEYMDDWEKFDDTSLTETEDSYIHLNMKDITDADYAPAKGEYFKRISWLVCLKRYITVSWCICKLLKYVS